MGEGIEEIAVGVFLEALQGHGTPGGRADELFQLIAAMGRDLRVGVEGKAVDAGATRPREPGRLTLVTKSGADAPDVLAGPVPDGDAVLDGGGQGAGELRGGVAQRIIPGGHGGLQARLQIPQPAERADHAATDLLEDRGDVTIGRRRAREQAWFAPFGSAIEGDTLHEDAMEMEVHIERTAKALDEGD
jgi:hypothetical protein